MTVWLVAVMLLVGACATPSPPPPVLAPSPPQLPPLAAEMVIVLPHVDGTTGAVTMVAAGTTYLLDTSYAALSLIADGTVIRGARTAAEVQAIFGPTLQARPLPPVTYALYFVFGTDTLTAESTRAVQSILTEIQRYPAPEIVLIGHTDHVGGERDNDALSLQRAGRVREGLIRQGFSPDIITVEGRGKRDATGDAAKDRRVDLILR